MGWWRRRGDDPLEGWDIGDRCGVIFFGFLGAWAAGGAVWHAWQLWT
jgi:hypothetical protein